MKKVLFVLLMFWAFVGKGQEARLVLPVGQSDLSSACFSSDGKYVLTASVDARIWDAVSGKELHVLNGHTKPIFSVVFSTDNKLALTASFDNTARLFDLSTGKELLILNGHERSVLSALFSFDNKKILTASSDNTARIWDVSTGKELFVLQGHKETVNSAEFGSDGNLALTASDDSTARIWDVSTGKELFVLQGHKNKVNSAVFSSDNKKVITSSSDSTARIWDVSTGKELFVLIGHKARVSSAVFSKDNKLILTASYDKTAIIWDAATGRKLIDLIGHTGPVESAVFSSDNKLILSRSFYGGEVYLWNAETGREIHIITTNKFNNFSSAVFSSDNNKILTASWDFTARIWDVATGNEILCLKSQTNNIESAVFSLDNKQVLSRSWSYASDVFLWDVLTGKESINLKGHSGGITSSKFSPNYKNILTTSRDSTARVWDALTGKELFKLIGHKGIVSNAVYSPDLKYILTASEDSTACIWNAETGKALFTLSGHKDKVYSAVFSNDNKLILTESLDDTARIWDANTGKEINCIKKSRYWGSVFSPDNKQVLTKSDTIVHLWDVSSAKEIKSFEGHTDYVVSAVFSSDNKHILTASKDNTARLWDINSGKEILRLNQPYDIYTADFKSDNKNILTTSGDKTARIWNIETGKELILFKGHTGSIEAGSSISANFSHDDKMLITCRGSDHKTILWDAATGRQLYTRLQLQNGDWLVYDEHYRYDGSQGARDYLYFVCGLEVVDLAQVKDALYVPNLVQRIMNGENLDHLPKLKDLEICGVTPEIEPIENKKDGGYYYNIKARKGGVGKVEIYINGMLRQTVDSKTLTQKDGIYELKIDEKLIQQYQIADKETELKVIARTADNKISSRGAVARTTARETVYRKPSLHAIMVGIDDYKGEGLDLNYAAKDAIDLQTALKISTQKLFNVDDTNRVHFYNLTLDRGGNINGLTPDRNNILKTLEKIEKESKPEDVFVLFFAGHGEINPEKQLILLTAEASKEQAPNYSGILMKELLEKLAKIPAGKRILLLDACHSGAAINELNIKDIAGVRDGEDAEKQSQRLKELENLASKSGLAIITASSTEQKALELPQYEHGLMTYALLTTMLNDPEVLDKDNNLQLEDWLRQTEKNVSKLIENQSAQRFVPVNFSLGKVDEEVRKSIVLQEIPTILIANVLNRNTDDDDLDIKIQLKKLFTERATRGTDKILLAEKEQASAISVNITYELIDSKIEARVTLKKNKVILKQFNSAGSISDISIFVKALSDEILKNINN